MNSATLYSINRRDFLRLCLLTSVAAVSAACRRANSEPDSPAPTPESTPVAESQTAGSTPETGPACEVELGSEDADIWAWSKQLTGQVTGLEDCLSVMLLVNSVNVEVSQDGENFSADVPLAEGENEVTAVCQCADGQEGTPQMVTFTGRLTQRPKAIIQPRLEGDQLILDGTESQFDEREGSPITDYIWSAREGNPAAVQVNGAEFSGEIKEEQLTVTLPPTDGEYYFTLRVVDQNGREDRSSTYVEVRDGAVRIPDYDVENPAWIESAIVYGTIPRNFGSPAFQAVTGRLPYLQDLGINALWLAPVNVSPPGDYGYAVVDYFELNPRYGTKEDFKRMVEEAHARGIRVLMDLVPNHSSAEHPYYRDSINNGKQSHYWEFYDRDENGMFTHYFDWTHLPNLNYDNPEVQRWMLEASSYWVREFDIDGYRVDVAWGVTERKPEFWMEWRRELKRIKPDVFLLAEASARDPFYFDNGFDAAYDWTLDLGHWAWELVWDSNEHTLLTYNLKTVLLNEPRGYHPDALIFRFLNNNDTGPRFISNHGEGLTRVATALLLTLPGVPGIYTADEVGEFFSPYFDPNPLSWEENFPGLRDYHKKLIALRKEVPSLHSRQWQLLEVEPRQQVVGYLRYLEGNEQPVVVLLNFFEEDAEVEFSLPEEFQAQFAGDTLIDLLSDETITIDGSTPPRVPVAGFGARILAPQDWRTTLS
jgi:glycosidase